jgi:hypothetical protein
VAGACAADSPRPNDAPAAHDRSKSSPNSRSRARKERSAKY